MTTQELIEAANRRIDCNIRGCRLGSEVTRRGPGNIGIKVLLVHVAGCPNEDE